MRGASATKVLEDGTAAGATPFNGTSRTKTPHARKPGVSHQQREFPRRDASTRGRRVFQDKDILDSRR